MIYCNLSIVLSLSAYVNHIPFSVQTSVTQLSNTSLRPSPLESNVVHTLDNLRQMIAQTSANVTEANSTLTKRLQWLQDDQLKDHVSIKYCSQASYYFSLPSLMIYHYFSSESNRGTSRSWSECDCKDKDARRRMCQN